MFSKTRYFLSRLSKFTVQHFSKNAAEAAPKSSLREAFIDSSKFKEDILILYQSKETSSSRLISLGLFGLGLYDLYLYYRSDDNFTGSIEALTACGIFLFLGIFEWKLRKTPRSIWLEREGTNVIVEFYKFWGFSVNPIELETRDFRGFGPLFPRFNIIPIAKYSSTGKKKYLFFRTGAIQDHDVLKKVFSGYTFKVGDPNLNVNISKKAKSTYKI